MSLIKESVSVSLVDNISANLVGINNSVEQTINHFNDLSTTINNTENSFTNINKNIKNTENHFNRIKNTINNSVDNSVHNISNIGTAIDESFNATNINATIGTIQVMNDEAKKSKSIFEEFAGCVETIKVGFGKLKQLADISDQMTANTTKLDAMNDGVNTTQELQDKVFASARRSGMAFDSMVGSVSGLSQATGGLFSNDEAIQFTENLSKLYSMAGTGQDEMTAGMSQFAQAMGSGSIGLDELNSVPGLMEAIANGAGVPAEKIAEMATAGRLSADAVKGSLLNATSEINSGFQETPATWASVLTMMKDDLLQFFAPILQIVNAGAQFIRDNWAAIEPVFFGAAIAVGIFAAAMGIAALVTSGFFVTLLTNPLTGIAILIALVAMDIYNN